LQRAVEQHVVAAIARVLLGEVPDRSTLEVEVVDDAVRVRVSS
jgi:ATP-dependent Clp protease ATP-binding subunit ClpC